MADDGGMRIVVAGGSGFLGQPLLRTLRADGHDVTQLVRRAATEPGQLRWDPGQPVDLPDGTDAVINLCGANVGHRWTERYRREIRDSRVVPTATLAQAVARQGIPLLANASGVDFYGATGDRKVDETAPAGDSFLAGLSVEWEGATAAAGAAGARVVLLRTGMPLHRHGGLLKPQLLPFRLGVGGRLGNGRQWVPWLSLTDWLRAVRFILSDARISGPVNVVGPQPVTNVDFTRALAEALHRPAVWRIPKFAVRTLYGQYGAEGFRSRRVYPKVLRDHGFDYRHPTLREALASALD